MTNNQLAENSVNRLLNSVRLARDNAERADNRIDHSFYHALTIALEELQERRKADSEPVAYAWVSRSGKKHLTRCEPEQWRDAVILTPLYRHAQPAPERDNVRSEHAESVRDPFRLVRQAHAEWSDRQFGNVGPVGPLKHLAKEAIEAAEAPDDISEFADILMLVWDATRRAGFSDEQLAEAVAEKLERNKRRAWGEVKDGEPCHHVKN